VVKKQLNNLTRQKRAFLKQLSKHLGNKTDVIKGSVVELGRRCGKSTCRCFRGEKHISTFLSFKISGNTKLIYIPKAVEETVRDWSDSHKQIKKAVDKISSINLKILKIKIKEAKTK